MKKTILLFLFVLCLGLVAFQCEDDLEMTMEEEQKALNVDVKVIEDLAATSICSESTDCKYMGLGSKACGGPKGYVVYSTSINEERLQNLVVAYNKKEVAFNQKWGVISDCAYATAPTSVVCENNKCVAVY